MKKIILTALIFLAGCTVPENKTFFQKIEAAFSGDKKEVELEILADFPWQDVCIFKATNAYPSVAASSYADFISRKNLKSEVPLHDYGLLLMFINEGKIVREYYQKANFLNIKGNPTQLDLASRKQFVKFCSESDGLTLTYDDTGETPTLLISKRE